MSNLRHGYSSRVPHGIFGTAASVYHLYNCWCGLLRILYWYAVRSSGFAGGLNDVPNERAETRKPAERPITSQGKG